MALRLAKAGYYGGDPGKVLAAPVDLVLGALHYERFLDEYQEAALNLSRGDA